jgi:hypothetical protein
MARKNAATAMHNLTRRFLVFLPLFSWAFALCAVPTVAWAEEKVVAIVSVQTPPSLAVNRAAIESSIAKGLREARWSVLGLADTTRLVGADKSLLSCTGDVCAVQLTRVTKAHYLVWAEVVEKKRKYAVSLKLFDGTRGALPMASEYVELSAREVVPLVASAAESLGIEAAEILKDLAYPDVVPGDEHPLAAVVSVRLPALFQHAQDKAESAVGRGLELAGWEVTNVFESTRAIEERTDLLDCASETCMNEIGRITRAPYLIFAGAKMGKGKYTVSLSLFDAANAGKPLAREEEECVDSDRDCLPVARKIFAAARELGRKAIKLIPKSAALAVTPTTNGTPLGMPPAVYPPPRPTADRRGLLAEEPKSHTGLRIAGWSALGGGVALLGTSAVFFLYLDGKEHDCQNTTAGSRCFHLYNGKPGGYLFGGLGLVSAVAGAYILFGPGSTHPAKVALTLNGIVVGGEF